MTQFSDEGHRPHANHEGEPVVRNQILEAPYHLNVTLDTWGPRNHLFTTMYDALQSNWGDRPSRVECQAAFPDDCDGWRDLTVGQQAYVRKCFAGQTLPQIKEMISLVFTIDGVSRACTHQLVRTRVGAAFMQHGGRDNDWRHRGWVMPETLRRYLLEEEGRVFCLCGHEHSPTVPCQFCACANYRAAYSPRRGTDAPRRLALSRGESSVNDLLVGYLRTGRELYAALVDDGIPWQDARRLLWMGTSTYLHATYNYLALEGLLRNRLEHVMDWEINCVAQLMLRELHIKCPEPMWEYLGSASDKAKSAQYAGLESWPPDGKWPVKDETLRATKRTHHPEQNPFWVLAPSSMAGGPIEWIATNGVYPHDRV